MGGGGQGKNKKIEIKIEPYYLYKFVLAFRESTFITPRGGDEDVLKKAHIFTGLLLRLLVNFDATPSKFLKFSMPPPPLEFGIEGV
jgi:hypothetical protein